MKILAPLAAASVLAHRFNMHLEPQDMILKWFLIEKGESNMTKRILGTVDTLKVLAYVTPCGKYFVRTDNAEMGEVEEWKREVYKSRKRDFIVYPFMGQGAYIKMPDGEKFVIIHDWNLGKNSYRFAPGESAAMNLVEILDRTNWSRKQLGY